MVTIKISPTGFTASGHADLLRGNDIVCSAISILSWTACEAARNLTGTAIIHFDKGHSSVKYEGDRVEMRAILNAVCKSFREIARQYPDNVHIVEGNEKRE